MPTLLELQRAVLRLTTTEDDAAAQWIVADGLLPHERLGIYRNNFFGSLTAALRISFPAVNRLVGAGFFDGTAQMFVCAHPPQSAYLNDYGADFPAFLGAFAPAASLPYLADIARLEWAVTRALHAPDIAPLDMSRLAERANVPQETLHFAPHPAVTPVRSDFPIDEIWRATLAQDDDALSVIDLASGPVWLLVSRENEETLVARMTEDAWRFTAALCAGESVAQAVGAMDETDAANLLALHLVAGRFAGFRRSVGSPHNTGESP